MKISVRSARNRLAKVGIELAELQTDSGRRGSERRFMVTTPVGSEVPMGSGQVLSLLRDLKQLAVPA